MSLQAKPHQEEWYLKTRDLKAFAYFWRMRVGKTLPNIRTALHLYATGKINAVLLLAPNGVHLNWSRSAVPPELEGTISKEKVFTLEWSSHKAHQKGYQKILTYAMEFDGLVWVFANVEAIRTNSCSEFLERFTSKRRVLLLCDESHRLKTPKASCTKEAIRLSKKCPYRRILTGTPTPQGPFDYWSQFHILDPNIMREPGATKPMMFSAFKTRFGIWKPMRFGSGPRFMQLDVTQGKDGYRDLDLLKTMIAPYSSFLTQKDVYEHLPEEEEYTIYYEMSAEQKKAYRELRDEYRTELSSGVELTAPQAMVRALRLQQVSRGFFGNSQNDHGLQIIPGPNPALDALTEFISQVDGKFVIWCRFVAEVEAVRKALLAEGVLTYRFDGSTPPEERTTIQKLFAQDDQARGVVGTPSSGGVGVDLSPADTVVFFSLDFNLVNWDQAKSRIQNMNKTSKKILYAYVQGEETGDFYILGRLKNKQDLSATISNRDLKIILGMDNGPEQQSFRNF